MCRAHAIMRKQTPAARDGGSIGDLKRQSGSELADARRGAAETTGGGDQAEQITVDVGGAVGVRGLSELGMIQGVEVLHAEFQFHAFGNGSGFSESNVEIGEARTAEQVAMQAISAVSRVVDGIELREAWVPASVVGVVLQGKIGKAVGVEDKVAGDALGAWRNGTV